MAGRRLGELFEVYSFRGDGGGASILLVSI